LVLGLEEGDFAQSGVLGGNFGSEGGLEGLDSVAESLDIARGGGLGLGVPPVLEPVDTSTRARHAWGAVSA